MNSFINKKILSLIFLVILIILLGYLFEILIPFFFGMVLAWFWQGFGSFLRAYGGFQPLAALFDGSCVKVLTVVRGKSGECLSSFEIQLVAISMGTL